jgi:hypothetical protein
MGFIFWKTGSLPLHYPAVANTGKAIINPGRGFGLPGNKKALLHASPRPYKTPATPENSFK